MVSLVRGAQNHNKNDIDVYEDVTTLDRTVGVQEYVGVVSIARHHEL